VVGVRVRGQDSHHRQVGDVLAQQAQALGRRRGGDERIDDDPSGGAADECHDRQVEVADLVDPLGHLEQAGDGQQLGLPPQAGVHRVRSWGVADEPIGVEIE
jgi:hypothetical protein